MLRRNLKRAPTKVKEKAYQTLVRPRLEYSSPVWSPSHTEKQKGLNKQLESVQRRAARFTLNRPYRRNVRDSVSAMISELGWESLETRRKRTSVTLMYKVIHNLVAIPVVYHPVQWLTQTRATSEHSLQTYHTRIDAFKFTFFPRTVLLWNALPVAVVAAPTLDQFKVGVAAVQF